MSFAKNNNEKSVDRKFSLGNAGLQSYLVKLVSVMEMSFISQISFVSWLNCDTQQTY